MSVTLPADLTGAQLERILTSPDGGQRLRNRLLWLMLTEPDTDSLSLDDDLVSGSAWANADLELLTGDPWRSSVIPEPAASPDPPGPSARSRRRTPHVFACGGVGDQLAPGPDLTRLAASAWDAGLGALGDDELFGVLRAARRLSSWAGALELSAVGDLMRRRLEEEAAGQAGVAEHADDEIAAELTLTGRAAGLLVDQAMTMSRLPATMRALTAGDIDLPRAYVIATEVVGLSDPHAAIVELAVIRDAPGQTTGQLRAAVRRAVIAADPDAARKRKEQAQREARVERWDEPAGTAGLAGRDLPAPEVLAADQHISAIARDLRAAGLEGSLDNLRARVFLALLAGRSPYCLLPPAGEADGLGRCGGNLGKTSPATTSPIRAAEGTACADTGSADTGSADTGSADTGSADTASAGTGSADTGSAGTSPANRTFAGVPGRGFGWPGLTGSVNLTVPLSTWLGLGDNPGEVAGYGPLDACDSRALATRIAADPASRWCVTVIDENGHAIAHGCARTGPSPGPGADPPSRPGDPPTAAGTAWLRGIKVTSVESGQCSHQRESPSYRPPPSLQHLIRVRHATCSFPGCRRPATRCDQDHTLAYDQGGRTCECNLAPLCRRHHRAKQTHGWHLEQPKPGVLVWTLPSGRTHTAMPTSYPSE